MHAGHMLHCTENLLEVYWCLQKDGKENNQQGGMGHTKLYWYRLDCFMAKHMLGSLFMAKRMSLNAKQCLKKKSKK